VIRRRRKRHANHERWLVSYADFITLLFAFFVVMYATAQVDKHKMGQLSAAIQSAFQEMGAFSQEKQGTVDIKETLPPEIALEIEKAKEASLARPSPADAKLLTLQGELEHSMAAEISRHELALNNTADGLVISLRETGFFTSGSAAVRANSKSAFARIARLLTQQDYRIRIEGHTDNVPIHNNQFGSNWELSTTRATELVRLLVTNYGFTPEHLSAAGYAQYHPSAPNSSTDGRAQNRRVDIVVLRAPVGTPPPAKPTAQRQ
jgi:chemotaxis protein MotB